MSSPQTKAIAVISVILALGFAGVLVVTWKFMPGRQAEPDLQGFWEGAIAVRNAQLRLVVKVNRSPDGDYTATMDSIDQGAKDVPISAITLSNRTVRLELGSMQAGYRGSLNARATEISGQWQQRGQTLPLTLKRTTHPSTIAAPLSPAAYTRRPDAPLQGAWKGTLNAGGVPLRLLAKISEASPGNFVGTMDSKDQGARNMPLTRVQYSKPTVSFDIASIDGHYVGTLNDDASEIDGTWTQLGRENPLLLQRTDPGEDPSPTADAYAFASEAELQGYWNGTLDANGTKLRLALKIARATDKSYSASIDSLDQGAKDIPATAVTFHDSNVEVEWRALRALFHGRLEGGRLVGFWQQGPSDFPMEFDRTNGAARASAPKN